MIIGNCKFELVDSFCYLGDSIGQSGSCFEATKDRVRAAWKNFHSLLPAQTNLAEKHARNVCICSDLLYASETFTDSSETTVE